MTQKKFDKTEEKLTILGFGSMLLPIIAKETIRNPVKPKKVKIKKTKSLCKKKPKNRSSIINFIRTTQTKLKKVLLRI